MNEQAPWHQKALTVLIAVLVTGIPTYTAVDLLGFDPLRPTLIVCLVVLAKFVVGNRLSRRK